MAPRSRVVVVCWEGADWGMLHPLVDAGRMPHFEAIVNGGSIGELATLQPQLDPLLWTSLATGCRGDRHDVLDYVALDGESARPTHSGDRKVPALWNLLNRHGSRTHVVGWPSYPAEPILGTFVSQLFARHGDGSVDFRSLSRTVWPPEVADELEPLRVKPAEITLEEILPLVPRAAAVDQASDAGLAVVASWLAEWITTHNVATHLLERDDWDFAWVHYDAIDRFGHAFMRFHPPRMSGISERSFALYQHVMSMVYRFADMQLGRLVELAGEGATVIVCSAHGFRSGADRPKSTNAHRGNVSWHRPLGVFAARGPAIPRDEWLWGGTILDICPTILSLFGLPEGSKLDGRPLLEPAAESSPTGEPVRPSPIPAAAGELALSEREMEAMYRQLADDGYLERDSPRGRDAVLRAIDARTFNLVQVHLHAGQTAKAAELLDELVKRRPEVGRFALQFASCRLALGDRAGCAELVEQLERLDVPRVYAQQLRAELQLAEGNFELALQELFDIEQSNPQLPGIHRQIGEVYLAMQRGDEACRAFQKELERDADDAGALFGLGRLAVARNDFEAAAEYIAQSIAIRRFCPEAHYQLARSFDKLSRTSDALAAIKRSLAQRPGHDDALALLAKLRCQVDTVAGDGGSG